MSHTTTSTVTLNIPSILAFALLSFLAIRWLFFSPSSPPPARPRTRIPYDRIAGLAAAFPQADPRKIEWDLLCNGGNAQATANRILAGQLAEPPPSFRAQRAPAPVPGPSDTRRAADAPRFENLIQRYRLDARVAGDKGEEGIRAEEGGRTRGEWSVKKEDRQVMLKRRREEMVLEARRKMEARLKKEGAAAEG